MAHRLIRSGVEAPYQCEHFAVGQENAVQLKELLDVDQVEPALVRPIDGTEAGQRTVVGPLLEVVCDLVQLPEDLELLDHDVQ